jgi:uncharacterized membrane protein YkoI
MEASMCKFTRSALVVAFLVAVSNSARADSDRKGTTKDGLPAAVWKAVTDKYPKAELVKWDEDDGKLEYEVKIKVDGKMRELEITPEGRITDDDED